MKNKIPTIIALILLIVGVAAGVFLVKNNQIFKLKASPSFTPQDVRITNISDISLSVSWTTQEQTSEVIKWGKSATTLNEPFNDELPAPGFIHNASIKPLSPDTTYYFKIYAGGEEYDNNGIPWEITTGSTLGQPGPGTNNIISGTVLTATGEPVINAMVYVTVGGGGLLSTPTSPNGSWLISISSARSRDLASFINIDNQQTLLEISVNAGPNGISTAQAYPQAANPLPPLILGQVHDFKNLSPNEVGNVPNAQINLPQTDENPVSGFNVDTQTPPATTITKSVTLDSIKDGEVIAAVNPEFFGSGPAGTTITIKVESENPVTQELNIPQNETWNWTPPSNLNPGNHTITITWKDAQGILRTLSKNFVVSAAEGPAFVSTPSATLKPTGVTQPTTTPTPRPTATATATATATPILNVADTPVSGDLTPTVLLFMISVGVIFLSIILWKKSEIN